MGTTAHGIWYPEDYNAASDVPANIQQNAVTIEAALVALEALVNTASGNLTYASPIGSIIAFGGAVAPAGWHLCDGTAHGSAALQTVIGSANTPDLRGKFIAGAGAGSYALKATGGADQVILTGAQSGVAAHAHTASASGMDADHTHIINPPSTLSASENTAHSHTANPGAVGTSSNSHNHSLSVREGTGEGDGYFLDTNPSDSGTQKTLTGTVTSTYAHTHTVDLPSFNTGTESANHQHAVDIAPFASSGVSADHSHSITVNNAAAAGASSPHENRPPYYALTYIIRKA